MSFTYLVIYLLDGLTCPKLTLACWPALRLNAGMYKQDKSMPLNAISWPIRSIISSPFSEKPNSRTYNSWCHSFHHDLYIYYVIVHKVHTQKKKKCNIYTLCLKKRTNF